MKILDDRNFLQGLIGMKPYAPINGVRFSHYPSVGKVHGLVHNHVPFIHASRVNVSVEAVNYSLVALEKVISYLAQR